MNKLRIRAPLSPAMLLAAAQSMIGLHEEQADARGQVVEMLLRQIGQPMDGPWHAAFIHHVGYWSHFDADTSWSSWPLPATGDCDRLWRFANDSRIGSVAWPQPGEIFLLWSGASRRFMHSGIVVRALTTNSGRNGECVECLTIEGNISEKGRLAGPGMHRHTRLISPEKGDRFIRWADLDRAAIADRPERADVCMARMLRGKAA